uniref:Peptidase M13 N-terminal domain-containing protein n=1 Tax=Tetranychus urticae TaxID=32264 RepID=T1KHZ5_TETUR
MYKTCTNVDAIESRANQPLINIITAFGGWLSTSNTISYFSQLDFADIVLKLKELGVNFSFLIAIDIGPDLKNTSNNIIAIDQAELVLKHKGLYTEDSYLATSTLTYNSQSKQ